MPLTSNITDRPRSLVSHVMHLAGADPLTARMFIDASGKAALKRLAVKPAVKARTRTTAKHGRHVTVKLTDKITGEEITKNVRRRRKQTVDVYRYSFQQIAAVLADMKPRKAEYKELRDAALATVAARTVRSGLKARRLPRQRQWSKRRHNR